MKFLIILTIIFGTISVILWCLFYNMVIVPNREINRKLKDLGYTKEALNIMDYEDKVRNLLEDTADKDINKKGEEDG